MARPKYQIGDRVKFKEDGNAASYVDPGNPHWRDVETVKSNIYEIIGVHGEWGDLTYYDIKHPKDTDYTFEVYEHEITKERVRPPNKAEMKALYKSLGVKV